MTGHMGDMLDAMRGQEYGLVQLYET
jgi:hypothetical protein